MVSAVRARISEFNQLAGRRESAQRRQVGCGEPAVELLVGGAARFKQFGEDDDATLDAMSNLAQAYTSARQHKDAIPLARRVLDTWVKKYGDNHWLSVTALIGLGRAYHGGFKLKDARDLFEHARDVTVPKLGDFHPQTLAILHNLTLLYRALGQTADAIAVGENRFGMIF